VNLLHQPKGALAPAPPSTPAGAAAAAADVGTGPVPHQLRGFMADFSVLRLSAAASGVCTACSPAVLSRLEEEGDAFLRRALEDPAALEEASGLTAMKAEADALDDGGDWGFGDE